MNLNWNVSNTTANLFNTHELEILPLCFALARMWLESVCICIFAFCLHPVRDFPYDIRIDANKRINKCCFNNFELYSIDGVAGSYNNLVSFFLFFCNSTDFSSHIINKLPEDVYLLIVFISADIVWVRRRHENGFDNGTLSPSSIVCGNGLFLVSGKNKLAIPPSVSKHPIMISGSTSILLPYFINAIRKKWSEKSEREHENVNGRLIASSITI